MFSDGRNISLISDAFKNINISLYLVSFKGERRSECQEHVQSQLLWPILFMWQTLSRWRWSGTLDVVVWRMMWYELSLNSSLFLGEWRNDSVYRVWGLVPRKGTFTPVRLLVCLSNWSLVWKSCCGVLLMLQHLDNPAVDCDVLMEMICVGCMNRASFLWTYATYFAGCLF